MTEKVFNPEDASKEQNVLRVTAKEFTKNDGKTKFLLYKGVVNSRGKLLPLKFTRSSGFPEMSFLNNGTRKFVLIEPTFNIDWNNLSPTIWVKSFVNVSTDFNSYIDKDIVK